jgi:ligand-binding sensor domain-containing protein
VKNYYLGLFLFILTLTFFAQARSQSNTWQFTGGPYLGSAAVMECNASGHVFAGTSTGLYRSTDNGNNWTCVTSSFGYPCVTHLAIKPDGKIFMRLSTNAIYRSDDNGDNWTPAGAGLPTQAVTDLKCKGADSVLIATDSSGIYFTTSDGTSWTAINNGLQSLQVNKLFVQKAGRLYATTASGVHYSLDNGAHWDTLPGMSTYSPYNITVTSTGKIFCDFSVVGYRWSSTDNGASWVDLSRDTVPMWMPVPPPGHWVKRVDIYSRPAIIMIDTADNLYSEGYTSVGSNAYLYLTRSTDGKAGTKISDSVFIGSIYSYAWPAQLCFSPNGYTYAAVKNVGISRSSPGNYGPWTGINGLIGGASISAMAAKSQGKVFSMTLGGLYRLMPPGNTWERNNLFNSGNESGLAVHPNGDIFLTHSPNIYRSTDDGAHWDTCGLYASPMTVAITPNGNIFTGSNYMALTRSTDHGNTWQGCSDGGCITLVAGASGNIYGLTPMGLMVSGDSGNTWHGWDFTKIGLTFDPNDARIVYSFLELNGNLLVGSSAGVVRSTDHGVSWAFTNNGLPAGLKYSYYYGYPTIKAITSNSHGDMFVGSAAGVWCSTNNGDTWFSYNEGLPPSMPVYSLAIDSSDFLYAGTTDGTVYKTSQITVDVKTAPKLLPGKYSLEQNYPNPFNPSTQINYELSKLSKVSLKVYDLLGREVANLVNEQQSAGPHTVTWEASPLATGVYFYRLEAGSFVQTKKMLLMK